MSEDRDRQLLRLPKKHLPKGPVPTDARDGERLVEGQSVRDAAIAAMIAVIVFSVLFAMLSRAIDVLLPWMTIVLGFMVGKLVQRAGRGLDWRFPAVAASAALVGALVANVVVAAAFTAREFGISTFAVLGRVTSMTWPVFFDEMINAADLIYALFAAAVAAFFAKRRLNRAEFLALRKWQLEHER